MVTLCCCSPLGSVGVCDERVTWAIAPMEETIRPANASPANEPVLSLGNVTLGKKERLFIRYRSHPPRVQVMSSHVKGAQADFHSKLPVRFVPGKQLAPVSGI